MVHVALAGRKHKPCTAAAHALTTYYHEGSMNGLSKEDSLGLGPTYPCPYSSHGSLLLSATHRHSARAIQNVRRNKQSMLGNHSRRACDPFDAPLRERCAAAAAESRR